MSGLLVKYTMTVLFRRARIYHAIISYLCIACYFYVEVYLNMLLFSTTVDLEA